jgi:carboxymethylenebutenolidase
MSNDPAVPGPDDLVRTTPSWPCSDGFALPGYLVRPGGGAPRPALVLVTEVFGLTDEMRRLADTFASHGYAVLAPDLFARGSWVGCVRRLFGDLQRGEGRGVSDLLEARSWLAGQPEVEGERVGVIGFCLGGGFALLLGKTGLFRVSAPFYGQTPATLDGTCPVVGSWGERDRVYLSHAKRAQAELQRLGVPHDVKIYPGAGHSFMNRMPNRPLDVLARAVGAGFQPEAAADATERVVAFLEAHL